MEKGKKVVVWPHLMAVVIMISSLQQQAQIRSIHSKSQNCKVKRLNLIYLLIQAGCDCSTTEFGCCPESLKYIFNFKQVLNNVL